MCLSSLWEFRWRILYFLRKYSGRFVKIVFAVSSRKTWGKHFLALSEFGLNLFWPSMENFRQFCQNCFLRLKESFALLFFYILTSQNHSWFWRKASGGFQNCVSNFQRNILQVAFSMSRGLFRTKISLCKKQRIRLSSLSDFGQKKTLELRVNFSAELSKTHSTPSVESLGKTICWKKLSIFHFHEKFF